MPIPSNIEQTVVNIRGVADEISCMATFTRSQEEQLTRLIHQVADGMLQINAEIERLQRYFNR